MTDRSVDRIYVDERIVQACRLIDGSNDTLTLEELGRHVGLSKGHLQRAFTRAIGMSPKRYAKLAREERHDVPSRGGKGLTVAYAIVPSSLGHVLVAATKRGICRVDIDTNERTLEKRLRDAFPSATLEHQDHELESATSRIVSFIANDGPWPLLPIDVRATAFQMRVWEALRSVAPGKTASYGDIARAIGSPNAARAVARACATNPIALLIPCHRIVPATGGSGGYRWGVRRKDRLLANERAYSPR